MDASLDSMENYNSMSNGDTENNNNSPEDPTCLITVKQLMSLIMEKSTSFILLDTRPSQDFADSHLKIPNSMNIPQEFLKPGTTAASVGRQLRIQDRLAWRVVFLFVVVDFSVCLFP